MDGDRDEAAYGELCLETGPTGTVEDSLPFRQAIGGHAHGANPVTVGRRTTTVCAGRMRLG
jgi:hypothetical protein